MTRLKKSPDYPSTSAWKYITIDEYCRHHTDDGLCNDRENDPIMETDPCSEADPAGQTDAA